MTKWTLLVTSLALVATACSEPQGEGSFDFESVKENGQLTLGQKKAILDLTRGDINFLNLPRRLESDLSASPPGFFSFNSNSLRPITADPDLADEWWIPALRVDQAWKLASGKRQVIAACDAGFYTGESDLADNLLLDQRRDFADRDAPERIDDGPFVFHGTAVAAIMAAVRDGNGTNGIAYNAKVLPLQNFNYDRRIDDLGKEAATAQCILYALQQPRVGVILVDNQTNTGTAESDDETREAIKLAIASGIAVVIPAGNHSSEIRRDSSRVTGSVVVGALSRGGRAANFSNFGEGISISAFGEQLKTLYGPNGHMETFGGTAAAAAQVAAIIALMEEANSDLTPSAIQAILIQTRRISAENANIGGQIDAFEAVHKALTWRVAPAESQAHKQKREAILAILGVKQQEHD